MKKLLISAVCVSSLAACGDPGGPVGGTSPQRVEVVIEADAAFGTFTPRETVVAVDGTVRWTNRSVYPHNVVFDDDTVESSALFEQGEAFETRFETAGMYRYVCTLHPGMYGTVEAR
jgi:plastocyanin